MADTSYYENQITSLEQELANLRSRLSELEQQQNDAANAANRRYDNLKASGLDPAADDEYQALAQRASQLNNQIQGTSNRISQVRNQLSAAREQLQRQLVSQRAESRGSDSAGQIVKEDGGKSGTNISQQQPNEVITPDGRITTAAVAGGTNAQNPVVTTVGDVNTNAPTVKLNQSQATSGPSNVGSPVAAEGGPNLAATATGVGAAGDDNTNKNPTRQDIATRFGDEFFGPQPNILDNYFSYTYVAEWHLLTPDDLRKLRETNGTVPLQQTLLVRSGGASQQQVPPANQFSSRAQAFDIDFYIDDVVVEHLVVGKGTNMAHNYSKISFRVIEPLGLTFFDKLFESVNKIAKITNPAAALYAMVITFYGYDENGKLVRVNNPQSPNDPYAVVKKVIPFNINEIKFAVESGPVSYNVTGTGTSFQAVHVDRGSIPYPIEIRGSTVGEMLGSVASSGAQLTTSSQSNAAGPAADSATLSNLSPTGVSLVGGAFGQGGRELSAVNVATSQFQGSATTNAPPKADAAVKPAAAISGSLVEALNKIQTQLVKQGIYEIADVYSIEFVEESIRSAKLRKNLTPDYSTTPLTSPSTARASLDETQATALNQRVLPIAPGSQIVQIIDKVIRGSSYLADQSNIAYDEVTGQPKIQPNTSKTMAWYKIGMEATPIGNTLDKKRNDYAYNIKFVISFYQIQDMQSTYFPTGKVTVLHKSYPYWFTGQNTAVIEYRQTYNYAYSQTVSGSLVASKNQNFTDADKLRKYSFSSRSKEGAQGAANQTNEPQANASEFLYDASALANSTMRIIGDPAWMMQGEVFKGINATNFNYSPFLSDGTINSERGEVLYEIRWQKSQDYDTNTGLMSLGPAQPGQQNINVQSLIYKAKKITSEFRGGKFEQVLEGVLCQQPVPSTFNANNNAANSASQTNVATLVGGSAANTTPALSSKNLVGGGSGPTTPATVSAGLERAIDLQNIVGLANNTPGTSGISLPTPLPAAAPALITSNGGVIPQPAINVANLGIEIINTDNPQIMSKET